MSHDPDPNPNKTKASPGGQDAQPHQIKERTHGREPAHGHESHPGEHAAPKGEGHHSPEPKHGEHAKAGEDAKHEHQGAKASHGHVQPTKRPPGDHRSDKPVHRPHGFWTFWFPIGVVVLLILVLVYIGLHRPAKKPPAPAAIPVAETTVRTGSINVILDALGIVTPVYTVTVESRVTGQITEVDYQEGQLV